MEKSFSAHDSQPGITEGVNDIAGSAAWDIEIVRFEEYQCYLRFLSVFNHVCQHAAI